MGKRSRKKERRRRPDGPRKRLDAPRFAEGRVEEALDWIAGAGWQDRASGHVHIEVPLALHHDQGRAVQRAVDALRRFPQIVSRLLRATKEAIEVVSMPLSRADADRMHERLCARAASGRAEQREALRMGLGASTETEPPEVATTYRAMAMTKADGTLVKPVDDSWLAAVDAHGRVDGGRDAGKPSGSLSGMDDEPRWAAGTGFTTAMEDVPDVLAVLAIGETPEEAAKRGAAIALDNGLLTEGTGVKVAPIHAIDGKMLREHFERTLEEARRQGGPRDRRAGAHRPGRARPGRLRARPRDRLARAPVGGEARRRGVRDADDRQRRPGATVERRKEAGPLLAGEDPLKGGPRLGCPALGARSRERGAARQSVPPGRSRGTPPTEQATPAHAGVRPCARRYPDHSGLRTPYGPG